MHLWTFIFTTPDAPLQSARVAANTRLGAGLLLSAFLGVDLTPELRIGVKAPKVLLQHGGRFDTAEEHIVSMILRDGRVAEAAQLDRAAAEGARA
ncbi:MAG: hypothetical protein ACREEN_00635 [Stellaceae bacterium]